MADGKVVIEILGDPAKFNEAVSGLSASTSSALSRVSSSMVGWGAGLSAAVTAPLTAAGVKAAKWALTTASAAEQADIALSTMLGPERAKQMIADLTDFAKKTPFEMSGLTDATQKLLAYGFTAEDVIPTLTAIGDATAALGSGQEGIDACTRAIGQMQAKGKVMSEEMLQLTEQGIPAWQYLADALGTDVAGAQEKVTKGSVDAATGIAALKAGMEGDFGGLMAEQSKTLTGALSNLEDAAEGVVKGIYKTDAYKELASSLAGLADPLGELVENLMPSLEGAVSSAAGAVSGLSSAVSKLSPEQVSAVAQALGLAAAAGPALMVAGKALGSAAAPAAALEKAMGLLAPASTAAAKAAGTALPAAAKGASGAFRAVRGAVGEGIAYVQLFREDAEGMAGLTWDALSGGAKRATDIVVNGLTEADVALAAFKQDPLGRITGSFSRLASTAGPALSRIGPAAVNAAAGVASAFGGSVVVVGTLAAALGGAALAGQMLGVDMGSALQGVASSVSGLSGLVGPVFDAIASAAPAAASALGANGPAIASAVAGLAQTIVSGVEGCVPQLVELTGAAAQVICETLVAAAPVLLEGAMQLFAGILQALSEVAAQMAPYVPQLISALAETFAANAPALLAAAGQLFLAIAQALPQVLPAVVAALPVVINGVVAALPAFLGLVLSAAVNLFLGIARALPQVLPAVLSAVGSLIGTVVSNIPTFIGLIIGSAVTLFLGIAQAVPQTVGSLVSAVGSLIEQAREAMMGFDFASVGSNMIQGVINGIGGAIGGLVDAAANAARNALDSAKKALGIASPSRKFRDEVGRFIPLGAAAGVEMEADEWRRSVDGVFSYVPEAKAPAVDWEALPLADSPAQRVMATLGAQLSGGAPDSGAQDHERSIAEAIGERIDAVGDRIERALGEPVEMTVNKREAGKIVRELVSA